MNRDIMDFPERSHFAPAEASVSPPSLDHVYVVRSLIELLDLFTSSFDSLLRMHEEEGLYDEVDYVAVAADTAMFCPPYGAFLPQVAAERTAKDVIGAVVIACNVSYLMPDAVFFEYWLKKLLLFSPTVATGAIYTRKLG